jgi:hypothetical protein
VSPVAGRSGKHESDRYRCVRHLSSLLMRTLTSSRSARSPRRQRRSRTSNCRRRTVAELDQDGSAAHDQGRQPLSVARRDEEQRGHGRTHARATVASARTRWLLQRLASTVRCSVLVCLRCGAFHAETLPRGRAIDA